MRRLARALSGAALSAALGALALAGSACDAGGTALIGAEVATADATADVGAQCTSSCSGTATSCGLDYCAAIPALRAPPVLDGVVDCGLPLASIDPAHWDSPYSEPADLAVEYAAAWRADGLYVFVHVIEGQRMPSTGPTSPIFCGDACHVFVDDDGNFDAPPAYDAIGTRQFVAEAPADAVTPVSTGVVYTPDAAVQTWLPSRFGAFPVADGYTLEAFIVASDLGLSSWTLGASQHVGFDLSVSYGGTPGEYADPGCHKRGDFYLRAALSDAGQVLLPHANTTAFCTPVLSASGT